MSLSRRSIVGRVEYMDKRIPKNAKYQYVKTKLDTGCSLTKYMEKVEEIKKFYKYRKDEVFKRLKLTTFGHLLLQVASVSELIERENEGELLPEDGLSVMSDADLESLSEHTDGSPQTSDHHDAGSTGEICTARSTLLSFYINPQECNSIRGLSRGGSRMGLSEDVISGVGELTLDDKKTEDVSVSSPRPVDRPYPDCPYLLLDVRDSEQYDRCHIISAHSFPIAHLSRTMNPYTKEVLEYKNAPGKIIIVYDEDERVASQAASNMCERGFENLFMLSGGLKLIAQKFPECMTTGPIPSSCLSPRTSSKRRKSSSSSSTQQPQAAEQRWRFTAEELTKIQEQLEESLIPSNSNSRMSSRMSTSSSHSKASSARSRQSSAPSGVDSARVQSSRPWK